MLPNDTEVVTSDFDLDIIEPPPVYVTNPFKEYILVDTIVTIEVTSCINDFHHLNI